MDLEFSGVYEKQTYFRAIAWIFRPARRDLILRIGAFVLFGGLYALTVFHSLKENPNAFESARLFRHLITFLLLGTIVVQPYLRANMAAGRLWRDPFVRRKIAGRVNSIGVTIDPMQEPLTWDQFVKVHHTPEMTVLLTAARTFVLLPRTFFRDEREWQAFRKIVHTRVQEVIE